MSHRKKWMDSLPEDVAAWGVTRNVSEIKDALKNYICLKLDHKLRKLIEPVVEQVINKAKQHIVTTQDVYSLQSEIFSTALNSSVGKDIATLHVYDTGTPLERQLANLVLQTIPNKTVTTEIHINIVFNFDTYRISKPLIVQLPQNIILAQRNYTYNHFYVGSYVISETLNTVFNEYPTSRDNHIDFLKIPKIIEEEFKQIPPLLQELLSFKQNLNRFISECKTRQELMTLLVPYIQFFITETITFEDFISKLKEHQYTDEALVETFCSLYVLERLK